MFIEIDNVSADLDDIQYIIALEGDMEERFEIEMNCATTLNDLLACRQAFLSQKNRLQWLQDGDRNLAFFHKLHSSKNSRASTNMIQVGSDFISIELEIGHHVVGYYEKLFKADSTISTDY